MRTLPHPAAGDDASGVGHAAEDAIGTGNERIHRVKLGDAALVEHHDAGAVHDGVEPVCYRQHRAVGKHLQTTHAVLLRGGHQIAVAVWGTRTYLVSLRTNLETRPHNFPMHGTSTWDQWSANNHHPN